MKETSLGKEKKLNKVFAFLLAAVMFFSSLLPAEQTLAKNIAGYGDNPLRDTQSVTPEVGKYGMTPVYGRDIVDGTYQIAVDSNNQFFTVIDASITVKGDEITGSITIGSHSYLYVFLGTMAEAKKAAESEWIDFVEDGDHYIFTFPVEALNKPIDCAAYSKRRKRWYNRKILFDASSLPKEALYIDLPDYDLIEQAIEQLDVDTIPEKNDESSKVPQIYGASEGTAYDSALAMEVPYEDGEYSIEVTMTGGTGRASISSPTLMIVKDGKAYAKILWSSSHYDWMLVGGEIYYNENTDGGNSYFIIPITDMNSVIEVVADTTAMGDPVAISYSLTFYADSIGNKGQIPQEAAKKVIIIAATLLIVGAIVNYFVKKKRRRKK